MTCFSTSDDSWAHTTTDPDRFNGLKPLPVGRLFNCTLSVQLSFFWKSNSPKTILTIFWHGYLWVVPHSRQGSQVQKVVLRNAHQGPTNRMWYRLPLFAKKFKPYAKNVLLLCSRNTVTTSRSFIFYLFKRISGYLNEYEVVTVLRDAKMCSTSERYSKNIGAQRSPIIVVDCA